MNLIGKILLLNRRNSSLCVVEFALCSVINVFQKIWYYLHTWQLKLQNEQNIPFWIRVKNSINLITVMALAQFGEIVSLDQLSQLETHLGTKLNLLLVAEL